MGAKTPYTPEQIKHAMGRAAAIGQNAAAIETKIPRATIQQWMYYGAPPDPTTKSELLRELSAHIIVHGPEISHGKYSQLTKTPGAFRKHWASWLDFRNEASCNAPYAAQYNKRVFIEVKDAVFLVGGDWHIWPYWDRPTALRALLHFAKPLGTTHVVLNGDVPDFPTVTHHRPIAWKQNPTLKDEMDAVKGAVDAVENVTGAERFWIWGNHCIRFDNRLAEKVPEYADITGMTLRHHFPRWRFQNAIRVNEFELEIKHRMKGGMYAVANNTKTAGINYLTGHDHNRQIYRWKDLRGTRYGINPGLAADPWGPQFEYQENHVYNHDSGLAVITFQNGRMMPPELIEVMEPGAVWFRGKRTEV